MAPKPPTANIKQEISHCILKNLQRKPHHISLDTQPHKS
jgi:hypothetical protein